MIELGLHASSSWVYDEHVAELFEVLSCLKH